MSTATSNPRAWTLLALRWVATVAILALVLQMIDLPQLVNQLSRVPAGFIVLALGLSVAQVALSAWRWHFTARQLAVSLPYPLAFREYYLAGFLNQVLPGGVMGDVNRAWRHSRSQAAGTRIRESRLAVIHAVVLERLSGQMVLVPVVIMALLALWGTGRFDTTAQASGLALSAWYWLVLLMLLAVAGWLLVVSGKAMALVRYTRRLTRDIEVAFGGWRTGSLQLATSMAVLLTYLGVFALVAVGMGAVSMLTELFITLALCSVLLLAMVVPITVSGWGVREGAAALLWPAVGWPAEVGVAISVGYGALVFLASMPGALVLFRRAPRA